LLRRLTEAYLAAVLDTRAPSRISPGQRLHRDERDFNCSRAGVARQASGLPPLAAIVRPMLRIQRRSRVPANGASLPHVAGRASRNASRGVIYLRSDRNTRRARRLGCTPAIRLRRPGARAAAPTPAAGLSQARPEAPAIARGCGCGAAPYDAGDMRKHDTAPGV